MGTAIGNRTTLGVTSLSMLYYGMRELVMDTGIGPARPEWVAIFTN